MSTLTAGSYLKLLRDPEMDLMDVIEEEAPVYKHKERYREHTIKHVLERLPAGGGEVELVKEYEFPHYFCNEQIDYERVHGLRFANCHQYSSTFLVEPFDAQYHRSHPVNAHNGSSDWRDWSAHRLAYTLEDDSQRRGGDVGYGLICWDDGVSNELYPGYPGQPIHLASEDDGGLDVTEELERAFDTIRPAITSDMSLLVTIAELKDVKSLFTEPIAFANKIVRLVGRKKSAKAVFSQIMKDPDFIPFLARSVASGHLYNEFGLKQTERDVCSLYSMFFSLDRVVRQILQSTGVNTRHYSIPIYKTESEVFSNDFQDYNWIISRVWNSVFTRKFVCTVKYTSELVDAYGQPISPNDPELVNLGAAMDWLGLNMNPAILWDLVPFSFVVDYFVGIGDWLERFKRSNLNLTFSVLDACYSLKREYVTEGTTHRWTSIWNGMELYPDHPLAAREKFIGGMKFRYHTKSYDRIRFLPTLRMLSGYREPQWNTPNLGQLRIMASLLTANLPVVGKRSRSRD